MPTPVAAARQCLTAEAAKALDDAVLVAQRRGHAQTTSLHAVSALLSHPSSTLRDACARARNPVHSTRLQFRALELSLRVSLDRAPSTSGGRDEPPVSNSLAAAIKRSQSAQRRQPEKFHLQQHSSSSVMVDLQHLILSILDDPIVSRVFAEAGFRSSEIKLVIIHPLTRLCNLTHQPPSLRRSFPFSFADHRRIAEVLPRSRVRCEPGDLAVSTADPCQPNLPPRLQIAELGSAKGLNLKLEDDGVVLNSSVSATHKKLDKIYRCLHIKFSDANDCPTVMGFQCSDNKRKYANNPSRKLTHAISSEYTNINSEVHVGKQMIPTSKSSISFPMEFNAKHEKYTSKLSEKLLREEGLESDDLGSCNMSTSIVCDGSQMSSTSVISVTTELGLGMCSSPTSNKSKKPSTQYTMEPPKEISSLFSPKFNFTGENIFKHPSQPSTFLSFDFCEQVDARNPQILFGVLSKEVSWQDEASSVISKTITCSLTKRVGANQRGDIWMNFVGPDRNGKKKIAVSLAKFLYGSRDSFIYVDLCSEEMKGCNVNFRGKTTLDFIVGEYCKKPFSVVFLENVDKADVLVQTSLSQAIKTGKLNDSHGREVGVKNAIFVASFSGQQAREPSNYSEERIGKVKGRPIKITVEHVSVADGSIECIPNLVLVNKRKFIGHNEFHDQHLISDAAKRAHTTSNRHLDLNLRVEENELQVQQMNDGNLEHASSENQNLWLQDLYDQVDETVVFKPFNFDALADRVLKVITSSFHKTIGSECALQIESEVMDQLLAAAVSDGDTNIENWVEEVLSGGFTEVQRRYNLSACSIVKLATCSDQASSVYLPPSIRMDGLNFC